MKIINRGRTRFLLIDPNSEAGRALIFDSIRPPLLKEIYILMNKKGVTSDLLQKGWSIERAYDHIAWYPIFRLRQIRERLYALPDVAPVLALAGRNN